MDIFFCDVCGVRVTDADLRAGHGIRSRTDVICGNCLEKGHGKEWLNRRKPKSAPVPATVGAGVASAANGASQGSAVVNEARDRAQTEDDGDDALAPPPKRMTPQVVPPTVEGIEVETDVTTKKKPPAREATAPIVKAKPAAVPTSSSASPQTSTPVKAPAPGDKSQPITDKVQAAPAKSQPAAAKAGSADEPGNLAAAANLFSALGQSSEAKPRTSSDDDLDDQGSELEKPKRADGKAPGGSGGLSPFGFAAGDKADDAAGVADSAGEDESSEKSGTAPIPAGVGGDSSANAGKTPAKKPITSSQRNPSSAKNQVGKKSGKSSSKVVKGRGKGGSGGNLKVLLFTAISAMVILSIAMAVVYNRKPADGNAMNKELQEISGVLKSGTTEARNSAIYALQSKDMAKLKDAKAKMLSVMDDMDRFGKAAQRLKWTENDVETFFNQTLKWSDTHMLLKNLNDEIQKQSH